MRADHAGQNRGVDRRSARSRAQTIGGADVVAAGRIDAPLARQLDRARLARRPVDAEALAGRDGLRPARNQAFDARTHGGLVAGAHEIELGRERRSTTGRKRGKAHLPPRQPRQPVEQSQHTDLRKIALEQRVRRLRRRVRDERDAARVDRRCPQQPLDTGHDARRDAARVVMRRGHLHGRNELARGGVDGDDVGERPADVDADADRATRRVHRQSAINTKVTVTSSTASSRR
jgi:hypothetical protein